MNPDYKDETKTNYDLSNPYVEASSLAGTDVLEPVGIKG